MKMRTFLSVTAAAAALGAFGFVPTARAADNIVLNQWYTGQFGETIPSPLSGPGVAASTDGPVLPGGFANAALAPAGTSWTITLSGAGTLTVTDVEESGDMFQLFDNGSPMTLAASPFTATGQNPGQAGVIGGFTSTPNLGDQVGEDIDGALGDANFSSGTFLLGSGANVITGTYLGNVGDGDFNFIAESSARVPEPATWMTLLIGIGAIGTGLRMRRRPAFAAA